MDREQTKRLEKRLAAMTIEQRKVLYRSLRKAVPPPKLSRYCPETMSPKQEAFLQATQPEILFGGAAGGGKTASILMGALQYFDQPNYSALLLRRTHKELNMPRSLIPLSKQWLLGTGAAWSESRSQWTSPEGGVILMNYLDRDDDKWQYGCFRPDTEILTDDGWKNIADVKTGELAATINPATRTMEYRPVSHTWTYQFSGNMVELYQRFGTAFSVTPNHTIWATTNRVRNKLRPFQADQLPFTARIPQAARWIGIEPPKEFVFASPGNHGKTIKFKAKEWAEFLGWYIAEGCVERKFYTVRISQVGEKGRSMIAETLGNCALKYRAAPVEFRLYNRALYEYLAPLGHCYEKHMPKQIKSYSPAFLMALLRCLLHGDGTWYENYQRGHFVTSSERLKDDVCEVAVKCGYRATVDLRLDARVREKFRSGRPIWHVALCKRSQDTWVASNIKGQNVGPMLVAYRGPVHCVTVPPYHTVLIRHRGRISWSGQSAGFNYIGIDEAAEFPLENTYTFLFSRLRREEGSMIPGRMRLGANPIGPGALWLKKRFLVAKDPERLYIPAKLTDNPFIDQDDYRQSLAKLDSYTRQALEDGNWDAKPPGKMFRREWFKFCQAIPAAATWVRFWDFAATPEDGNNNPSWSCGVKMGYYGGRFFISDVRRKRDTPGEIKKLVKATAILDGLDIEIYIEQEPGSSGQAVVDDYVRFLPRFVVRGKKPTGPKDTRAAPFASQAEAGNVWLKETEWNEAYLEEMEQFPPSSNKIKTDQVDASSGAYEILAGEVESDEYLEDEDLIAEGELPRPDW